jgi:hypothetical protein
MKITENKLREMVRNTIVGMLKESMFDGSDIEDGDDNWYTDEDDDDSDLGEPTDADIEQMEREPENGNKADRKRAMQYNIIKQILARQGKPTDDDTIMKVIERSKGYYDDNDDIDDGIDDGTYRYSDRYSNGRPYGHF